MRRADSYYIQARLLYEGELFIVGKEVLREWPTFIRDDMFELDTHDDTNNRALDTSVGGHVFIRDMQDSLVMDFFAALQSALCWDPRLALPLCAQHDGRGRLQTAMRCGAGRMNLRRSRCASVRKMEREKVRDD